MHPQLIFYPHGAHISNQEDMVDIHQIDSNMNLHRNFDYWKAKYYRFLLKHILLKKIYFYIEYKISLKNTKTYHKNI